MNRNKLSRREFLRLGVAAAGGVALASCGGAQPISQVPSENEATTSADDPAPAMEPTTGAPPTTEAGTISYWTFWGNYGDTVEAWRPKLEEKLAPNKLDVRTGVQADEVFLTAVAAGTPPDVGTGHHYIDYMSKEQAVAIDELVAQSDIIKEENFSPAAWTGTFYKGKQYGVSAIEAFVRRGLNYNVRMVEEAGLDPEKPPVTWAETLEWHKALTKFDDAGNLVQFGLDPFDAEGGQFGGSDGSFPNDSFGGGEWYDVEAKKFNANTPQMVESFKTMAEFVKIIGPDNLAGMRSVEGQGTWGAAFSAEVQAMIIEGYWHPGETAHEAPEVSKNNRATWIPVPEERRGVKVQQGGGHMVLFYKGAKNPAQAAFPLAEFLNTADHCDPVFKTIGWLPDYKPYLETVDPSPFPGLDFYIKSVEEATEWHYPIWNEIQSFAGQKYTELYEQVFREQMTAEQAAEELQRALEQEWQEAGYDQES